MRNGASLRSCHVHTWRSETLKAHSILDLTPWDDSNAACSSRESFLRDSPPHPHGHPALSSIFKPYGVCQGRGARPKDSICPAMQSFVEGMSTYRSVPSLEQDFASLWRYHPMYQLLDISTSRPSLLTHCSNHFVRLSRGSLGFPLSHPQYGRPYRYDQRRF